MLIDISGRTDIINYYSEWMFKRFEEGWVLSRNSLFPNSVRRYELTPDKVDCLLFGSKNYAPVLGRMHEITERFATYFDYTITAYGKDIEPGVPDIDTSIDTFLSLAKIVGPQRMAWRYDPILLTEKYTVQRHLETFDYISGSSIGCRINGCRVKWLISPASTSKGTPCVLICGILGASLPRRRSCTAAFSPALPDLREQTDLQWM